MTTNFPICFWGAAVVAAVGGPPPQVTGAGGGEYTRPMHDRVVSKKSFRAFHCVASFGGLIYVPYFTTKFFQSE